MCGEAKFASAFKGISFSEWIKCTVFFMLKCMAEERAD